MRRYEFFILIAAVALIVAGVVAAMIWQRAPEAPPVVYCTQEAMMCPDGSFVGRGGPRCEFAPCPGAKPPADKGCTSDAACEDGFACHVGACVRIVGKGCLGEGDGNCGDGYRCVQSCGAPVVREGEPAAPWYCEPEEVAARPRVCPICLAKGVRIATPDGEKPVESLSVGDRVWSEDADGARVAVPLVRVIRMPVPKTHRVTRIVLDDGREVWASPEHPTAAGKPIGSLKTGETYDGGRLVTTENVLYWSDATYDILPESVTGTYWANGIRLGSTLR